MTGCRLWAQLHGQLLAQIGVQEEKDCKIVQVEEINLAGAGYQPVGKVPYETRKKLRKAILSNKQ